MPRSSSWRAIVRFESRILSHARFTMTVYTLPLRHPALTQRNCYNVGHSYEANAASKSPLLTHMSVYLQEANTLQLKQLLTPN